MRWLILCVAVACAAPINQGYIIEKTWEKEYSVAKLGHCFYQNEFGICLFRGPDKLRHEPANYYVHLETSTIKVSRYVWDRVQVGDWYPPTELSEI